MVPDRLPAQALNGLCCGLLIGDFNDQRVQPLVELGILISGTTSNGCFHGLTDVTQLRGLSIGDVFGSFSSTQGLYGGSDLGDFNGFFPRDLADSGASIRDAFDQPLCNELVECQAHFTPRSAVFLSHI